MKIFSNLPEELCKTCGLCCQGVFFSNAAIYNEQDEQFVKNMQVKTFYLDDDKLKVFPLPCLAFDEICTVYLKRPSVCHKHECDLLRNYKNRKISFEKSISTINKMQDVLKSLLPELKKITNNFSSNNPEFLRKEIIKSFHDRAMSKTFKNKHKEMLMHYSLFLFLKETQFYIPSCTDKDDKQKY